jgi:hypothetical protein
MARNSRRAIGSALALAFALVPSVSAQDTGTGDVFGDLVHILRDAGTGQPVLAQRWIELPGPITGYGWGYCPIPVDTAGSELAFIPYTCDPLDPTSVVAVDYFGRLNASRTKERNNRMHFDEVIATIKTADWVDREGSGRLRLGFGCTIDQGSAKCAEWATIDSPMENLGLYTRLVKYGHLQTDPLEIDTGSHGDPSVPITYHPALATEDWAKLAPSVRHLLPGNGEHACFGSAFDPTCAQPEPLDSDDLVRATGFVAGGADKTGHFTADLVQYLGRIMKLTQDTEGTVATLATIPALVRDCWPGPVDPPSPAEGEPPVDPPYLPPGECTVAPADALLPNYSLFPVVQERFVDFSVIAYVRVEWRSELVSVILPISPTLWQLTNNVSLLPWLQLRNGSDGAANIAGFVLAANDSLRWIEFIHNYEVPEDLSVAVTPGVFTDGFESGTAGAWSSFEPGGTLHWGSLVLQALAPQPCER